MRQRTIELQLKGYGLTTAEILYHMPDYPAMLQSYVWQEFDLAPNFPNMHEFLDFWRDELEGPLHSVRYAHRRLIRPGEWQKVDGELLLN
ncbi:MAG: usg protein [Hyphomicrobiales bacterium]